jgi:hypothetical protein
MDQLEDLTFCGGRRGNQAEVVEFIGASESISLTSKPEANPFMTLQAKRLGPLVERQFPAGRAC